MRADGRRATDGKAAAIAALVEDAANARAANITDDLATGPVMRKRLEMQEASASDLQSNTPSQLTRVPSILLPVSKCFIHSHNKVFDMSSAQGHDELPQDNDYE